MKSDSRLESLMQEIDKYAIANSDTNVENPMTFIASIGIEKLTSLVQKANEINSMLEFSYKGRKLEWKFKKTAGNKQFGKRAEFSVS